MTDIILSTQNGEPVASSRQIAESFGKEHRNVMRDIENLMTAGVLKNEQTPMFYKTEYTHEQNGQTYPMYLMNRDGFTLLAMGFTGKAALEWKLRYIQAFNAMEKQLAQRPQLSRAELMAQALIAAHDELEHKDRQIAELTPKGIFADAVNASKKSILVGETCKAAVPEQRADRAEPAVCLDAGARIPHQRPQAQRLQYAHAARRGAGAV